MLIFTFQPHTTVYMCILTGICSTGDFALKWKFPNYCLKTIYETIILECQERVEKPLAYLGRANEYEPVHVSWKEVGWWQRKT